MRKVLFSLYFGLTVFVCGAQDVKHVVKSGEGMYAIARQYGVKAADIMKANPSLLNLDNIRSGQTLVIPVSGNTAAAVVTEKPVAKPKPVVAAASSNGTAQPVKAKVHTVAKGEGLFAICKKYGALVSDVRRWNSLATDNVRIGQKLIVAKENSLALYKPIQVPSTPDTPYTQEDIRPRTAINPELANATASLSNEPVITSEPKVKFSSTSAAKEPKVEVVKETKTEVKETKTVAVETGAPATKPVASEGLKTSSSNASEYNGIFNRYSSTGLKAKRNRGAANYLTDNISGNQYLALYNLAENGSIIRVTNMMNNKSVYAKVVGKVPPADAANEVVVKLTNTIATELGAVDEKFLVEVTSYCEK